MVIIDEFHVHKDNDPFDQFATEHVHGHQFTSDFVMHPVLPIPLELQELAPVEHVPTETPDVRQVSKKCPTNLKSEGTR
jgi:hypothetical protein